MDRCKTCGAALSRGAIRCPRCGKAVGEAEYLAELSEDDLWEAEGSGPEELPGLDRQHSLPEAGWEPAGNVRGDRRAFGGAGAGTNDGPELELAGILPHEEREKQRKLEQYDDVSDEERARALAGYGESPKRAAEAATYAVWVAWRQLALRGALRDLEAKRQAAQARLEAAYREGGESLFERGNDPELMPLRDELLAVAGAQQKIRLVIEEDRRVKESVSQEMEYVVDTIFDAQKDAEPFRIEESRLLARFATCQKKKVTLESEISAAEEAYREHGKNLEGEPDAGWLEQVEQERRERETKLKRLKDEMEGLTIDLEEVRIALKDTAKKVDELHQQRKTHLAERMKSAEHREAERHQAENELEQALRTLGRLGFEQWPELLPAGKRERIDREARLLQKTGDEVVLHQKALAGYDRNGVIRGSAFIGGLVAALIVVWIALAGLSDPAAPVGGEEPSPEATGQTAVE